MKTLKRFALIALLLFLATTVGVLFGYRRGFVHGEKITNKWWIDQQSQYYDASEVIKKRRALNLDTV
jgi:membrane protein DedA with SNARE-associated domain